MALKLIDTIPIIKEMSIMKKYARYLHTADFRIDPLLWIIYCIVAAIIISTIMFFIATYFNLEQSIAIGILGFIVILDLGLGYPYLKAEQKIEEIEEILPDALRQMADTLKSGGTYELAIKEVATSDYGPLKVEMNEVLRKLEEGENFENSFKTLAKNIDSRLVKRTVTIITNSIQAGAGLSNVLEQIAEDVRAFYRIAKERKASTAMQVIFMFVAGALIAPMIFGFVSTISKILITSSGIAATEEAKKAATEAAGTINLAIQLYIFIETFFSALMISIMREGKISKTIIYFPILVLIAYVAYLAAAMFSSGILGVKT